MKHHAALRNRVPGSRGAWSSAARTSQARQCVPFGAGVTRVRSLAITYRLSPARKRPFMSFSSAAGSIGASRCGCAGGGAAATTGNGSWPWGPRRGTKGTPFLYLSSGAGQARTRPYWLKHFLAPQSQPVPGHRAQFAFTSISISFTFFPGPGVRPPVLSVYTFISADSARCDLWPRPMIRTHRAARRARQPGHRFWPVPVRPVPPSAAPVFLLRPWLQGLAKAY